MSDTPETDAFIVQNTTNEGPTGVKWRSHAERLERERDEAREALAIAREALRLIAEEGGQTAGRTIIPDGAWCAEQARKAL